MTETQNIAPQTQTWHRVVDRLATTTDPNTFWEGMLELQCVIVAAKYGATWAINPQGQPSLLKIWPPELQQAAATSPVMKMLADAAQRGVQRTSSHVLKIQQGDSAKTQDPGTHLFVTVIRGAGNIAAVATVVADYHDDRAAEATGPMRVLAAGLYEGFLARAEARQHQNESNTVRQAMALLAVAHDGRGFTGACLNLVNEMARLNACSRVSLGWVRGRSIRLAAISGTEHFKRHSDQVKSLELAMAECLDQQQPLIYPLPPDAEPLLAHAVVHEHRRLAGDHTGQQALSIPLRNGEQWVGVLTLEKPYTPPTGFTTEQVHRLQLIGDVLGPHLADRRSGDRWLVVHAWHSLRTGLSYLVGPKHVVWKCAAILLIALIAFAALGRWNYRVTAQFVLEAHSKRIVPAAYEGRLSEVNVEPGMIVKANQILARQDDTEWSLQLAEARSQLKLAYLEKSKATAEGKQAEAQQAEARAQQTKAHIQLLQYQIEQATIRSPIDGFVLSGNWKDKVGGVIEQGKPMFEIAPLEDLLALVRVNEADINDVNPVDLPAGEIATRSEPEQKFTVHVTRIVPLASPVEGENVFELRCRIDQPAPWLRPGMEGLAKIDVGSKPIYWIFTHKIVDTVRLWLWKWVWV